MQSSTVTRCDEYQWPAKVCLQSLVVAAFAASTILRLSAGSGSYCASAIVGSGNTMTTSFTHYPIACTVLTLLSSGLLTHGTLSSNIHTILWGDSPGFVQVTNFLPTKRQGNVVIWFLLREATYLPPGLLFKDNTD